MLLSGLVYQDETKPSSNLCPSWLEHSAIVQYFYVCAPIHCILRQILLSLHCNHSISVSWLSLRIWHLSSSCLYIELYLSKMVWRGLNYPSLHQPVSCTPSGGSGWGRLGGCHGLGSVPGSTNSSLSVPPSGNCLSLPICKTGIRLPARVKGFEFYRWKIFILGQTFQIRVSTIMYLNPYLGI